MCDGSAHSSGCVVYLLITLGAHAQRGLQYLLCVLLQLQGSFQPATNGIYGTLLWIQARGFSKKPSVQKLWRQKTNMQLVIAHCEPFSRTFWTNETQELLEAQPVSRILLQTLATVAAGVK